MSIKSTLTKKNDLLKLLTDPGSVKRDLEALTKKGVQVTKDLKELYEGKSKKAALELISKSVGVAEDKLKELEGLCQAKIDDAEKQLEEFKEKVAKESEKLSEKNQSLLKREKAVEEGGKYIQKVQAQIEKELAEAKASSTTAGKLKSEYEDKVKELKEKFKGL